jgi:hypothetical protein
MLQGVGRKDPSSLKMLSLLAQAAAKGDPKSKEAWWWAAYLESAARKSSQQDAAPKPTIAFNPAFLAPRIVQQDSAPKVSVNPNLFSLVSSLPHTTAGDGVGDGYGVPGYVPPPMPIHTYYHR